MQEYCNISAQTHKSSQISAKTIKKHCKFIAKSATDTHTSAKTLQQRCEISATTVKNRQITRAVLFEIHEPSPLLRES